MDSSLVCRLENVANRMEHILQKYDSSSSSMNVSNQSDDVKLVSALDVAVNEKLDAFYSISRKIGDDVEKLGEMTKSLFSAQRDFILMASGRAKPDDVEMVKLIQPVSERISEFTAFKEKNFKSKYYDHICAMEAAVFGIGWLVQPKTPAPFINDALEMTMFYVNRILKTFKGTDDRHVEWTTSLRGVWTALHLYVKQNHTCGLVWNAQPKKGTSSVPAPPPPPPPMILPAAPSSGASGDPKKKAALLESLNTGLSATKRLKKVRPEMQTHKNPALRGFEKIPKTSTSIESEKKKKTLEKKEPRIFFDDKIWRVDFQEGNLNAVVTVNEKKESIYIYKCSDSIVKIIGKANSITLDSCRQTSVVFDGLVAQCEVINSQSIQIQTLGDLPTVSIQKTDGCHVYLSRAARNAQIVTSKSSEMNVSAQLDDDGDEEYTEMAIPEQFVTQIVGKKLVTSVSEIV